MSQLTHTASFTALTQHYDTARHWEIRKLFDNQPDRFEAMSLEAAGLLLDYSKNRVNSETIDLLMQLARERGVEERRDAMFAGEHINMTEDRAVLHVALRMPEESELAVNGHNVIPEVHAVLAHMREFTDAVRDGTWRGGTGEMITDVVNIGIGGSDLGPVMVCRTLRTYNHERINVHFVANADGSHLDSVLRNLHPETTLFIVASKTFTTRETMLNAQSARTWFTSKRPVNELAKHFVAVSTNTQAVRDFGIDEANMFPFWDWVGGRYSVWCAIGLPVMIAIGHENFSRFLAGGHAMDQHFRTAPLEKNMPVLLAMLGVWYRNFFKFPSQSIAPYSQDMNRFTAHMQQLDMESNGKSITMLGQPCAVETGPMVWGEVGTNGQHAYFQFLHQGSDITPTDFIAALNPSHAMHEHHMVLLANCFAQSEAFMRGKTAQEVEADLRAQGMSDAQIQTLLPHRVFPGNRPSNTILMDHLSPANLGALIALYEHKIFVQGTVWGINSFDQWGVELGKSLAKQIELELDGTPSPAAHDASTNALIARARAARHTA